MNKPLGTLSRRATSRNAIVRLLDQIRVDLDSQGFTPSPDIFSPKDLQIFKSGIEAAKVKFRDLQRNYKDFQKGSPEE